jgi:hypothetical protein
MQFFDKILGKLLYLLIIALFLFEFSAGLAIAHLDAVYECHACSCELSRHTAE